jgi:antitoxin ParD1/3/4
VVVSVRTGHQVAMSVRKTVSVSLSPELHAMAEGLPASGRYNTFSEAIRAGPHLLDERETAFDATGNISLKITRPTKHDAIASNICIRSYH